MGPGEVPDPAGDGDGIRRTGRLIDRRLDPVRRIDDRMQGPVPLDLAFMRNEDGIDIGPEGYVGRPAKMTTGQLEDLPVEVGRA